MKTMSLATALIGLVMSLSSPVAGAKVGNPSSRQQLGQFKQVGTANWTLESNAAAASSGNGFLVSSERYGNFRLKVEFSASTGTNSGIFFRCQNEAEINDRTCYEANIFDTRPDQTFRTGAITGLAGPKETLNTEDGKFHTMEVYAFDDQLQVIVDGRELVQLRSEKFQTGFIALQIAQGAIQFRNLELEILGRNL